MKTKMQFHAEAVEILNKPGRFAILRQWVNGGAISHDNNNGNGYSAEESACKIAADKRCAEHRKG